MRLDSEQTRQRLDLQPALLQTLEDERQRRDRLAAALAALAVAVVQKDDRAGARALQHAPCDLSLADPLPVEPGHSPLHRPQAHRARRAEVRGGANAARRAREARTHARSPFNCRLRPLQLSARLARAAVEKDWVRVRVVPDLVLFGCNAPRRPRVALGVLADHEERRARAV